ncbi:Proteasome subunit A N-terminal signature Add an annotation [Rhizoctonia solani]|uniref:Proteasome subunit A N-terminal signature Add an annotation n=1 Tax=Rhizoctonia solani TaxID=456999 RepID=A0A8H7H978_9AGAM
MPSLRLGSVAPDFSAETTQGPIRFHEWLGNSWGVLFSHPADFTPKWVVPVDQVCTTELGEVARRQKDFEARGVKVIGISANGLESHSKWIEDINEVGSKIAPTNVDFPIIADADRQISTLYDMLDAVDPTNVDAKGIPFTVSIMTFTLNSCDVSDLTVTQIRTVFVIDPKKVIRLTISYPAQTGRSFDEILRVIDSLQLGDKHRVTTPVNWKKGDDVIIHPGVSDTEAQTLFPNYVTHKPYLRTTTQPN